MSFMRRVITIIKLPKPKHHDVNITLQWFGNTLGLFNLRDKDKSCFRVFITLLKASKMRKPLSSDQIASILGLTRGTVIHHINKLMAAGIVVRVDNKYLLRVDDLARLVNEIKRDIDDTLNSLVKVANELDSALEF